jgi:hypothetical protein
MSGFLATVPSACALAALLVLASCTGTERRAAQGGSPQGAEEFTRIAQVLKSPRCINCHPAGNSPHQGDEARVHDFGVTRGPADRGAPGMNCSTCHRERNQEASGVPGASHWQLAPLSMAWEGLSDTELCRVLLERSKNGGRTLADLVRHMTDDALVKWAWAPGGERAPPPIAHEEFLELIDAWATKGAACPPDGG